MRAAAIAAVLSAVMAAPSQAYVIGGTPWPGGRFTYYPAAGGYAGATSRAARILDRAGLGVHVRKASSRSKADVTVAYGGRSCEGSAEVGYVRTRPDLLYLGRGCSKSLVTLTAVHEFGHVLGLDHENQVCARMNPSFDDSGTPTHCKDHSLAYWLKHPLTSDDRAGLRALYGG
jgi:Matrixin